MKNKFFIGRYDSYGMLKSILSSNLKNNLNIVSLSGPGGIGKTYLLHHVLQDTLLNSSNWLKLSIKGVDNSYRTLGSIITKDLPDSCNQVDISGTGHFKRIKRCRDGIKIIDEKIKESLLKSCKNDEQKKKISTFIEYAKCLQELVPKLKEIYNFDTVDGKTLEEICNSAKESLSLEWRFLGGVFPDLFGSGFRNRLKVNLEEELSKGLHSDLAVMLSGWNLEDAKMITEEKVKGIDRLLLIIDDYESLQLIIENFLIYHLIPEFNNAKFKTLIIVLGRDRLTDTNSAWRQHFSQNIIEKITLDIFSREEADELLINSGIKDESIRERIIKDTKKFPYLLTCEIDDYLHGGISALSYMNFFDRVTRWINKTQKKWMFPICFLDNINLDTLELMFPKENTEKILEWFKRESSIRSPTSEKWTVLPIIRSKVKKYIENDSPKTYAKLKEIANHANAAV